MQWNTPKSKTRSPVLVHIRANRLLMVSFLGGCDWPLAWRIIHFEFQMAEDEECGKPPVMAVPRHSEHWPRQEEVKIILRYVE